MDAVGAERLGDFYPPLHPLKCFNCGPFAGAEWRAVRCNQLQQTFVNYTISIISRSRAWKRVKPPGNGLIGTSAYGLWTLEIQDDRVGATNNTVLENWELQFVFADTNPIPAVLTPGTEICNPVPANSILWYQVNVPLNALFATNTLFSSDQPVNLLFNPNSRRHQRCHHAVRNQTNGIAMIGTAPIPCTPLPRSFPARPIISAFKTRTISRCGCLHRGGFQLCWPPLCVHGTGPAGHGNQRATERHGHAQRVSRHRLVPMGNEHAVR